MKKNTTPGYMLHAKQIKIQQPIETTSTVADLGDQGLLPPLLMPSQEQIYKHKKQQNSCI